MHQRRAQRPVELLKILAVGTMLCAPASAQIERADAFRTAKQAAPVERQAIASAMAWLTRHQDADGKWSASEFMKHDPEEDRCDGKGDARHDLRVTGLALMALMANGSTMRSGPHRSAVKRAVIWIKERQIEGGLLRASKEHPLLVDHAIATFALSEAYQISRYRTLKRYVQLAVNALEKAQNPDKGWGRAPNDEASDPIATAWALFALRSAKHGALKVNTKLVAATRSYVDKVSSPMTGLYGEDWRLGRKQAGSNKAPKKSQRRKTSRRHAVAYAALGIIARRALGQSAKTHPPLIAAADQILKHAPRPDSPAAPSPHGYYFGSLALWESGGRHWKLWSKQLGETLCRDQRSKGSVAGSWNPSPAWKPRGGRVEATALAALTLSTLTRATRLRR